MITAVNSGAIYYVFAAFLSLDATFLGGPGALMLFAGRKRGKQSN